MLLVVILKRREAQHQRAAVAERAQAHVHAVDKTVLRGLVECFDKPLPEAREKLRVIQLAASALRGTAFRPGEDKIDIRRKVEFAAAEFSHAEDHQRLRDALRVARRAPFATAGGVEPVARGDDKGFRKLTKLRERFLRGGLFQRLRPGDTRHHPAAELAQRAHQRRLVVDFR